jgi:hypothetical protein
MMSIFRQTYAWTDGISTYSWAKVLTRTGYERARFHCLLRNRIESPIIVSAVSICPPTSRFESAFSESCKPISVAAWLAHRTSTRSSNPAASTRC